MNVGDGFYQFGRDLFGRGFELQKRWVTRVDGRSFRHAGGATESHCDGTKLPRGSSEDPRKAFEAGKDNVLIGLAGEKVQLLKKLRDLEVEERRVQSLKFEHVRIRGDNETYAQFKRHWDSDF
jgi:hypothetical protein